LSALRALSDPEGAALLAVAVEVAASIDIDRGRMTPKSRVRFVPTTTRGPRTASLCKLSLTSNWQTSRNCPALSGCLLYFHNQRI
jgi:hypothetical protein